MKKLVLGLVLASSLGSVCADDLNLLPGRYDLSEKEIRNELIFAGTLLVDYNQTLDIKNHPGMYETNPILGQHPSDARIRNYFLLAGLGHYAVTKALPSEYRPYWQYGWIALEVLTILHNQQIGLKVNFQF